MTEFDLAIIGAGQGGLPPAALAARTGLNMTLLVKRRWMGMSLLPVVPIWVNGGQIALPDSMHSPPRFARHAHALTASPQPSPGLNHQ